MDLGPYLILASLEGAVGASVLALTAVGLSLVFGVMRVVNIAHGEFFMLGAVIAWWIAHSLGGHPALGFAVALIVAPVLVGAIAVAGGAAKLADENGTVITRGKGEEQVRLSAPVSDIQRGEAPDVELLPGDIVFVPESPF